MPIVGAPCSCRACELSRATHPQAPPSLIRRRCRTCKSTRAAMRIEPADTPCPTCDPAFYADAEAKAAKARAEAVAAKAAKKLAAKARAA